jgi:hypothetical protein
VNSCPALSIKFRSYDAYLQPIITKQRKRDCDGVPQAFWSGHDMSYGLNVRAACDSNGCFLYFGVMASGKCPDQMAFKNQGHSFFRLNPCFVQDNT